MAAPFSCAFTRPLPPDPAGWYAVDYKPLQDGSLACFQATTDIRSIDRRNSELVSRGEYEKQTPYFSAGDRARLVRADGTGPAAVFPIEYPFPRFDQLAGGGWIVVNARCREGDLNAVRLTDRGEIEARFAVGDGVEQVQADARGDTWVSHFDEGLGDALGSAGIARFDASGCETWRADTHYAAIPIVDCRYALNVAEDATWACYYSEFPIVRIGKDGEARAWVNSVAGASAMAVDGNRVVLFGGYGEQMSRIALLELHETTAACVGELRLTGPEISRDQAVGRGDTIHLIGDGTWRRFTVAEIVAAVAAAGDAALPDTEA